MTYRLDLQRRGVRIHSETPHVFITGRNGKYRWCCCNKYARAYAAKPKSAYRAWQREITELCLRPNAPYNIRRMAGAVRPPEHVVRQAREWDRNRQSKPRPQRPLT